MANTIEYSTYESTLTEDWLEVITGPTTVSALLESGDDGKIAYIKGTASGTPTLRRGHLLKPEESQAITTVATGKAIFIKARTPGATAIVTTGEEP